MPMKLAVTGYSTSFKKQETPFPRLKTVNDEQKELQAGEVVEAAGVATGVLGIRQIGKSAAGTLKNDIKGPFARVNSAVRRLIRNISERINGSNSGRIGKSLIDCIKTLEKPLIIFCAIGAAAFMIFEGTSMINNSLRNKANEEDSEPEEMSE